ncbi:unnamed protein product, partial [marine sediment metagenome]
LNRTVTPDGQLRIGTETKLLIDAKYKGRPEQEQLIPPSPSREDLYEAAVFMGATNCSRILLVYPRVESTQATPAAIRVYRATLLGKEAIFCTSTVDLAALAQGHVEQLVTGLLCAIVQTLKA